MSRMRVSSRAVGLSTAVVASLVVEVWRCGFKRGRENTQLLLCGRVSCFASTLDRCFPIGTIDQHVCGCCDNICPAFYTYKRRHMWPTVSHSIANSTNHCNKTKKRSPTANERERHPKMQLGLVEGLSWFSHSLATEKDHDLLQKNAIR